MKALLLIPLLLIAGCVSVPIPPFGDRVGDLGTLKLSVKAEYLPKSSPERGLTFATEQENDATYIGNNINGSAISGITLSPDYTNIEIDLSDSSAPYEISAQSLYNYYIHLLTTSQGIANFFGAITPIDRMNYQVNSAVVPIKIQNTGSTDVVINGGRIFRDDGVSIISTGTGAGTGSLVHDTGFLLQFLQPQVAAALTAFGTASATDLTSMESRLKKKITQAALL